MNPSQKNPEYRPNSNRAVHIFGPIDQGALERLARDVLPLQCVNREPLTIFIDSQGGSTFHANQIAKTLRLPDQETLSPCRIITVGLNLAASAACDLLVSGDYALVYPHTVLLCHGVRQSGDGMDVTREAALSIAQHLAVSNEQYAIHLAESAISRFIFRFVTMRHLFTKIRLERSDPDRRDDFCFLDALEPNVSPQLSNLLQSALNDTLRTTVADLKIRQKLADDSQSVPRIPAEFEALVLTCLIEQEVSLAVDDSNWSFRREGFQQLETRFLTLLSSYDDAHLHQIARLARRWGRFLLDEKQTLKYEQLAVAERDQWLENNISPLITNLWFLFVGICRRLQQNENYISAQEAYWIGLVDEVIGMSDLPNPRMLVEFASKNDASN